MDAKNRSAQASRSAPKRTLVILNGDIMLPDRADYDYCICCDGGYDRIGDYAIDLFVGDCDSVTRSVENVSKITLAHEKDYTDGEYAVRLAIGRGAREIDLVGALGGDRIDHVLTNLTLLSLCQDNGVTARILDGRAIFFVSEGAMCFASLGARYISFAPLYGSAHIKESEGLKYAMRDLTITASSSIGVSNEPTAEFVALDVDEGRLLTVIVL